MTTAQFKDAVIHAPFLYRLILLLLAGVTLSFIQAPTNLWPLIFPCLGLFYLIFSHAKSKTQAFFAAFIFAFGYFVAGLFWIGNALLVEGNEYKWAWPLAVIALPMALSILTALHLFAARLLFKQNTAIGFLGFCAALALSEYTRGHAFTGFPWNLFAYSWIEVLPIAQAVSVIGPYGLTFLTLFWGALAGFVFCPQPKRDKIILGGIGIISFAALYVYGAQRLSNTPITLHPDISITIVQPNIAQEDKWNGQKLGQNFEKHIQLSENLNPDKKNIIIWSETALPPIFLNNAAVNQRINSVLGDNDILLAGVLDITPPDDGNPVRYHNALGLWQKNQPYKRLYSKSHLVPFGEYIPFQGYIPIPTVTSFSGFEAGAGVQDIEITGYPSFSPLICYEVIFPQASIPLRVPRPDYILTITNDGWYGDSAGPYQHFVQARFRAIEQGVPVVRAANTGISGVIDPLGQILHKGELLKEASIISPLPEKTLKPTLYNRYQDMFFWILIILCLIPRFVWSIQDKRF